jgi:hypothetical protein
LIALTNFNGRRETGTNRSGASSAAKRRFTAGMVNLD